MLLVEIGVALSALLILALNGGFALAPFSGRYLLLAAPLAGIAVHVLGAMFLYGVLKLPYVAAAGVTIIAGAILTIAVLIAKRPGLPLLTAAIAGLPTIIVLVAICATATISIGSPAISFLDGTDHAGYAHLADWLVGHPITEPPVVSPDLPYQSWPELLFKKDPRFGSFALLASVSLLRGTTGLFAYDSACVIALSAGILGVAGVFARRPATLALLLVGLLVSHWFDYGHGGYLGKVLSYPAVLVLAGLFMSGTRDQLAVLAFLILAAGVATLHSGLAAALQLAATAGAYVLAKGLMSRDWRSVLPETLTLASAGLMLVATTGVITRPVNFKIPDYDLGWSYILPRIFDLENQGVRLARISDHVGMALFFLSIGFAAALLLLAIRKRNAAVVGLVAGPLGLLAVLVIAGRGATAFQLIGFFYPVCLCAAARFADDEDLYLPRAVAAAALASALVFIGMRLPRFVGAIKWYAVNTPAGARYSQSDIEQLSAAIGQAPVRVDVAAPQPGLVLLLELGARSINVQWSERSWDLLYGYRQWPAPVYSEPPAFTITRSGSGSFILAPAATR